MRQKEVAIIRIREMILQGILQPGQRVTEAMLAEQLELSRTPVRQALPALAEEGLLAEAGARGYIVKSFTLQDIINALDIRAALEGLAARTIAEKGASADLIRALTDCLDEGDALFIKPYLVPSDEIAYANLNSRFHDLIVEAAQNSLLEDSIKRISKVPFAGVQAMVGAKESLKEMTRILSYAHRQHHAIVEALRNGEGSRVEALMREHANPVKQGMRLMHELLRGAWPHQTIGNAQNIVRLVRSEFGTNKAAG